MLRGGGSALDPSLLAWRGRDGHEMRPGSLWRWVRLHRQDCRCLLGRTGELERGARSLESTSTRIDPALPVHIQCHVTRGAQRSENKRRETDDREKGKSRGRLSQARTGRLQQRCATLHTKGKPSEMVERWASTATQTALAKRSMMNGKHLSNFQWNVKPQCVWQTSCPCQNQKPGAAACSE